MIPACSVYDMPNSPFGYAKHLGQFCGRPVFLFEASNGPNIRFSELAMPPCIISKLDSMLAIFLVSAILKVIWSVIEFVSINMIDFFSMRAWSNKGRSDDLMNFPVLIVGFGSYIYLIVAAIYVQASLFSGSAFSSRGSNVPNIRDFVKSLPAYDWFPNLVCGINLLSHDAARLSGCRVIRAVAGVVTRDRSFFLSEKEAKV